MSYYKEDYERTALEMKAALEDLQAAESRAAGLQRRMAALHVLIVAEDPKWERAAGVGESLKILRATSRPTEQLKRVFDASEEPLTIKELRAALKSRIDLSVYPNPSGTIGALCARLVEQGVIRQTKKGGKNAWGKI